MTHFLLGIVVGMGIMLIVYAFYRLIMEAQNEHKSY